MTGMRVFSAQVAQLVVGPGEDDPVPGQDQRAAGLVQQARRPAHGVDVPLRPGPEPGEGQLLRVLEVADVGGDVLGDVDQHRAGAPGAGDVEGLPHHPGQVLDVHHQVVVLGDGHGDPGGVGLLEGVLADHVGGHLPGQDHHGHRVHHRRGDPGDHVGGPRAGGADADPHLARGPGVAVRHVRRPLLVAAEDVLEGVVPEDVVQRDHGPPGHPEERVHPLAQEALAEDLRPVKLLHHRLLQTPTPHTTTLRSLRPARPDSTRPESTSGPVPEDESRSLSFPVVPPQLTPPGGASPRYHSRSSGSEPCRKQKSPRPRGREPTPVVPPHLAHTITAPLVTPLRPPSRRDTPAQRATAAPTLPGNGGCPAGLTGPGGARPPVALSPAARGRVRPSCSTGSHRPPALWRRREWPTTPCRCLAMGFVEGTPRQQPERPSTILSVTPYSRKHP